MKKLSPGRFPETRQLFFWPKIQIFFVMNIKRYNFSNFVFRPTQSLSEYLAVSFSK